MKRMWKSLALALVLCGLSSMAVSATQGKIDEVQEGIEDLEQQREQAKEEASQLSNEADSLEGDLKEFNNSLAVVIAELNETERQLNSTRDNLEDTRKDLKAAKKREKEQYASMKKRIQFLYEMDTEGMLEVLLSAENFADFLSKGEYIISIHNYDRKMLEEYRETKNEIAGKEKKLEEDEALLANLQDHQEAKKQELAVLVDSTSEKLGAAKKQLAAAQADVQAYEAEIERQKAYEAELEKQKAAEDAKRMEEIKRQEEEMRQQKANAKKEQAAGEGASSGSSNSGGASSGGRPQSSGSDSAMLAAIIQCEAGGESYEGKLAVGSVVLNRVSSSHFPNTIAGVIYQGGQFSPVASGRFASVRAAGANASCRQAAGEVLNGNITIGALYFRRNDGSIPGTVIGNHVFY